ncbi:MAG: ABC transporter permease subunit [Pirellulaceae bacterium]
MQHVTFGRTMQLAVLIAVCSLAAVSARADTLAAIRQRGVLVWGADAEGGGPYVYPRDDDPNQFQGFEVELAQLLAAQLGVTAQFAQGQWDKLPDLLHRGDVDIVLNGYEWKEFWYARYGVTIPYYIYELQMLVRRDDSRLTDLASLRAATERKFRVAVLGGSAAETYLREEYGDVVEPVVFDASTTAMRAVELTIDGVDATLQDLPIVTFYEQRYQQLQRLGPPIAPGYYVILARPEDETLVRALNAAILATWQDGRIPAILRRYGLWNEIQRGRGLVTDSRGNFRPDLPAGQVATDASPEETESRLRMLMRRVPLLFQGALMTILLSVTSMPLAIVAGLLIALGRLYGPALLRYPLGWYVELVRGTPLVLQLYLIFFLLPELGLSLPALGAAILGLAANYAAYEAEIYRAGLQAIPHGQLEAALSLGMSRSLALRRIIVPQAVRLVIPPVTNDFIALFKDTAICSVITVVELSKEYYIHAQSTGAVVELGIVTALFYLAMSYPLTVLVRRLERRLAEGRKHD